MRPFFIVIVIVLTACASKTPSDKAKVEVVNTEADTCSLNNLYVDSISIETKTFRNFWLKAEQLGYTFRDDTIVPFVKVVFQPKPEKFYSDTLVLSDCKVLNGLNIHRMEIQSRKPIQKNYYPNLVAEEWELKDAEAASKYANAWAEYINKGYGVKSPTVIVHKDSAVYMFQTAAYLFRPELERMVKVFDPNAKIIGRNY